MATDTPMQLGMLGLGRMGANLVRRLMRDGHHCVGTDVGADTVAALAKEGMTAAADAKELVAALEAPRTVWVMVPAGEITERAIADLAELLSPGDTIIDGGNTRYHDDIRRAQELSGRGLHYVDCGTSGGVFGLERGFCLMIGGEEEVVSRLAPIFTSLAPGLGTIERTPGRSGDPSPDELGWLHCGPAGAGHFVKMVHNGIEYGLMAAYAEGLNVLHHANAGSVAREADAETTPLEHPELYRYDLDLAAVAEVWRRGSVIASWLLDLTAAALHESPALDGYAGRVSDSGEGRWTSIAAIDTGTPAPVLTAALYRYDLDLAAVAEVWRRGSVIASWLLDLTAAALHESPALRDYTGRVSDSGEGRWTSIAAIDTGTPAPVLTAALYDRFSSRAEGEFAHRLLSAMRHQFGGHLEKTAG